MSDDLVKRLRDLSYNQGNDLPDRAADRIEQLEAALRGIIEARYYGMEGPELESNEMKDIARAALEGKKDER